MKTFAFPYTAPLLSLLLSSALCTAALAETDTQRLERLDRDLQNIQRQLSRGEVTPGTGGAGDAQLEVRLSAIEDEMKNLRGKAEENEFQIRKLTENVDRMQRDVEMRFTEINNSAAAATTPAKEDTTPADATSGEPREEEPAASNDAGSDAKKESGDFTTPREHYNYAFRLLNQTKYKEAADSFEEFTKKYPKDPLVGNAYYWQGETYYIRRDYVNAADMFRQGFEALPDGPKAADNLLKLAMSLNALKRDKEACVVLQQLTTRYVNISKSIGLRAMQEKIRIGCK